MRTPTTRVFVWRYMFMRQALLSILDRFPEVEAAGVESSVFGEVYSEGMYGLFLYTSEALFLRRINTVYFDPHRVKLLAKMDPSVRRGTMDKSDMVDAAKADTGIKRWNHNEADAFIIARSAARFWEFQSGQLAADELTPSEQHVFALTRTITKGHHAGKVVRQGIVFKENDRFYRFASLNPEETAIEVDLKLGK